jgi:hypothetical protein
MNHYSVLLIENCRNLRHKTLVFPLLSIFELCLFIDNGLKVRRRLNLQSVDSKFMLGLLSWPLMHHFILTPILTLQLCCGKTMGA